ncbi:MAG: alpha/beta hydrolase fold protein [Thermomicrobiales bacterium]|jgi:pimeloyl-ACP methyl ester carboxylesterase|nr:alpha/beta hydrolase fold protein [Thermomicrobiales bacterium]
MAATLRGPRRALPEETLVRANGVDLCVQTFGDPADPAILLIHGAMTSMLGWEDAFCQRLEAGDRFVIRYDHRDTGRSVSYPPGKPPYSLRDLTADTIGVLDALGVDAAHFVGMSMGGGIAMLAGLDWPDRVASLTLIGTSSGGPDLPPMSPEFLAHVSGAESPDWSDAEAVVDHMLDLLRLMSANSGYFEESRMRDALRLDLARTVNVPSSQINHFAMDIGDPIRDRLGAITAPTLVIHGDCDPVFPLGHAEALVQVVPGARLLVLERTGHELPPPVWDRVVPAILDLTTRWAGG